MQQHSAQAAVQLSYKPTINNLKFYSDIIGEPE